MADPGAGQAGIGAAICVSLLPAVGRHADAAGRLRPEPDPGQPALGWCQSGAGIPLAIERAGRWRYRPATIAHATRPRNSSGATPCSSEEHTSELQSLMRIPYA